MKHLPNSETPKNFFLAAERTNAQKKGTEEKILKERRLHEKNIIGIEFWALVSE